MTNRQGFIGGSDAAVIMRGEHYGNTLHDLWLEKTGQRAPEDLSGKLPVRIGQATEDLNREWYGRETGHRVSPPSRHTHPTIPWMRASLDGDIGGLTVFEAKHISGFGKVGPADTYYPQLQHYLAVTGWAMSHLSVFKGNSEWVLYEVPRDDDYIAELLEREKAFWFCVESMTPPPGWAPVAAPTTAPSRVVDMTGNNEFASHAATWLEHRAAASAFERAGKGIKALVPADAARAFGYGIAVTRDGRGLTIKPENKHAAK